jgi:maltose O-acetyltransferase
MIKLIQFTYNQLAFLNWYIRTSFWKLFFKKIWEKSYIMKNCTFYSPNWISLGNNVFINFNCILDWKWNIEIWNDVSLAPNVRIWSFNHKTEDVTTPMNVQWNIMKKVVIWNDVWLWDWSIILPWVTIWKWVIVAAWSVVTKDIEDFSVVWGNPAKLIKKRV